MKEMIVARETGENIAELVEAHTQSTHMKNVALTIRGLVEEAGELGYLVITVQKRVSVECACGCGRLFIPAKNGRMRKYYNDGCRQREMRKRKGKYPKWTVPEEQAVVQGLRSGMSVQQVANTLSRTLKSVQNKRNQLERKGLL